MSPQTLYIVLFSRTSLDSRINSWGSVSDFDICVEFRGSKKVEKHCCILSKCIGQTLCVVCASTAVFRDWLC